MTHWKASLHVLYYLKSTWNYCITYCIRYRRSSIPTRVFNYADVDYRSNPNDRVSYIWFTCEPMRSENPPFFPKQILHSSTFSTSVMNFSIFPAHRLPTTLGSLLLSRNPRHTYPDHSIYRQSEILSPPLQLGLHRKLQKPMEEN